MKKKMIISTILLLSLCISSEFNAATLQQKDNSTNKFIRLELDVSLVQNGILVPQLIYTLTNSTTGRTATYYSGYYLISAQQGDVLAFNLGGLIGIKQYTVTQEDLIMQHLFIELLDL